MESPLPQTFSKRRIVSKLALRGDDQQRIFEAARRVKAQTVGARVYYRGLVEFSNICSKDCFYCGIRKGNAAVVRYAASDEEILDACRFALDSQYGSVVLQSGEMTSPAFVDRVDRLLKEITRLSSGQLGITLSCGEQPIDVYHRWRDSGAHRYLLRIETSRPELYRRLHPNDGQHHFEKRLQALEWLREADYQVGTGVMIGFPFQALDDLAADLQFFRDLDVDMVGMGPYVEHEQTPLHESREELLPHSERFALTLNMIACLRLMMPDINIAAATALQAIDPAGREKAISAGANVIMPNLTPCKYRKDYELYQNKPCTDEDAEKCRNCLAARIRLTDSEIAYGERGDSLHYQRRTSVQRSGDSRAR